MGRDTDSADDSEVALLEQRPDGTGHWRERVAGVGRGRPLWGGLLLAVGSLALGRVAGLGSLPLSPVTGSLSPAGDLGLALSVLGALCGVCVLCRPTRASLFGAAGLGAAGAGFLSLVVTPLGGDATTALVAGMGVAGLGGVLSLCWRPGGARLERTPAVRAGQFALAACLVVGLATTGVPATSAETFPQQADSLGGFVIYQGSLDTPRYNYTAACPAPEAGLIGGADGCLDPSLDSTTFASGDIGSIDGVEAGYSNRVARQELDGEEGFFSDDPAQLGTEGDPTDNFVLYKQYRTDGEPTYFQIRGDAAAAISDDADERPVAIDVYAHEYRAEELSARFDLFGLEIPVDSIDYWECSTGNASGSGSINDVRLGLDVEPPLRNGQDLSLTAFMLGSSQTTIQEFELTVQNGTREPIPADEEPTEPPSDCIN